MEETACSRHGRGGTTVCIGRLHRQISVLLPSPCVNSLSVCVCPDVYVSPMCVSVYVCVCVLYELAVHACVCVPPSLYDSLSLMHPVRAARVCLVAAVEVAGARWVHPPWLVAALLSPCTYRPVCRGKSIVKSDNGSGSAATSSWGTARSSLCIGALTLLVLSLSSSSPTARSYL